MQAPLAPSLNVDELRNILLDHAVIPARGGVQRVLKDLDSGLAGMTPKAFAAGLESFI